MASLHGDWFHSRSSSNQSELLAVRRLVIESQKHKYANFNWSGSRKDNPLMREFSSFINVEPSTMQTKIRAMIRYGFIKNRNTCPLVWTRMGGLWNELYTLGRIEAKYVYELTLTVAIAIFAFNNTSKQYAINPTQGYMPLKYLLNNLNSSGAISIRDFDNLVDGRTHREGKNVTYWKKDLLNSGLFTERNGYLFYSQKYIELVDEIKKFKPNPLLNDSDWEQIRENPLIEISPFKDAMCSIFENIVLNDNLSGQIIDQIYTDPLVEMISEQEELMVPEIDILSHNERFSNCSKRIRNSTWSMRIKKIYNATCAVNMCDVTGQIFIEASHIKPDCIDENGTPHRTHILNGLCLCKHCHIAFDRGFFSLTDDNKIIISPKFIYVAEQNLKKVILSSENKPLKPRIDNRTPLPEFIKYHRDNKFLVK